MGKHNKKQLLKIFLEKRKKNESKPKHKKPL